MRKKEFETKERREKARKGGRKGWKEEGKKEVSE